jgi:hypothetical protein
MLFEKAKTIGQKSGQHHMPLAASKGLGIRILAIELGK